MLLCNAGLVTGASQEDIIETFSKFGAIEQVSMFPGKSYSFVVLDSADAAKAAFQDVHGKLSISKNGAVLYLAFLNKIPPSENCGATEFFSHLPEGLTVIEEFVSVDEEQMLLNSVTWPQQSKDHDQGTMKNRQVLHFGHEFVYSDNSIAPEPTESFPRAWTSILDRISNQGHQNRLPDQCTVNKYLPGQGIPAHVDSHSCCDDTITSLSLGSSIVMTYKSLTTRNREHRRNVVLEPRSLLVMKGPARYFYSHCIVPRKSDIVPVNFQDKQRCLTLKPRGERVSFTFRKRLADPCQCSSPKSCVFDSSANKEVINENVASDLERQHVHDVYDTIADHFSETRHKPWPRVVDFLDGLDEGAVLVDVGCGNGKYLGLHDDRLVQFGCDYSGGLMSIARERGHEVLRANGLNLPYRDEIADACICIAVIHHFSTKERRLKAVREILRVLNKGGRGLIYVWAKDQKKDNQDSTYIKQNKNSKSNSQNECGDLPLDSVAAGLSLPVHKNRTNFEAKDVLVPWSKKDKDETHHRFYHVFDEAELEALILEASPSAKIKSSYYDQGNWCVVFEK